MSRAVNFRLDGNTLSLDYDLTHGRPEGGSLNFGSSSLGVFYYLQSALDQHFIHIQSPSGNVRTVAPYPNLPIATVNSAAVPEPATTGLLAASFAITVLLKLRNRETTAAA